jgi:hypothetical protein
MVERVSARTARVAQGGTSAICGTDLHFARGTMPGLKEGHVLGHEAVGEVLAVGDGVRNISVGDRVVVPSTICCGSCSSCRAGYTAQCDIGRPEDLCQQIELSPRRRPSFGRDRCCHAGAWSRDHHGSPSAWGTGTSRIVLSALLRAERRGREAGRRTIVAGTVRHAGEHLGHRVQRIAPRSPAKLEPGPSAGQRGFVIGTGPVSGRARSRVRLRIRSAVVPVRRCRARQAFASLDIRIDGSG